jgi:DNA-binding beta-propeller fold protein YncE
MRAAFHVGLVVAAILVAFAVVALTPAVDPASLVPGVAEVSAAANPSAFAAPARGTPALSKIKAVAQVGTPAASGPSANIGQTVTIKGAAVADGVATFAGYNGVDVTAPLTDVRAGKKAKAAVPNLAVTGDVTIIPNGAEESSPLPLQIVPTLATLSQPTVVAGDSLSINGTGFAPDLRVVFPGVAAPVAPVQFDNDSATAVVPEGVQKGKIKVTTAGGTSNTLKLKITVGLANRSLATDPVTGLIIATDDMANTVSVLDPATGEVLRTIALRFEPSGIRVDTDAGLAFVMHENNIVATLDLNSWEVTDGMSIRGTRRTASFGDVFLDVPRARIAGSASAQSADEFARESGWNLRLGPGVEAMAVTPNGARAVVVAGDHGLLYVVDVTNRTLMQTIDAGGPIEGVTIGVDGRVYTMDRATGQLVAFPVE